MSPAKTELPTDSGTVAHADFSHPQFIVKKWINQALLVSTETDNDPTSLETTSNLGLDELDNEEASIPQQVSTRHAVLEERATTLVRTIQLLTDQTTEELEDISDEVVRNVPRILYDLETVRKEACGMRERVNSVREEMQAHENNTGPAFRYLVDLDRVKTRMEDARASLREAQNWSNLADEVEAILGSGDPAKAATRLSDARRSLVVFANTAEYDERKALLGRLQQRLEEALSAQVVAAIRDHDTETCRKFKFIFDQIERGGDFERFYYESRKEHLLDIWAGVVRQHQRQQVELQKTVARPNLQIEEGDVEARYCISESQTDFDRAVMAFYDELLVILNEESAWCPAIGLNVERYITEFNKMVFSSLSPSMTALIAECAQHSKDGALPQIIRLYEAADTFGRNVEHILLSPPERSPETTVTKDLSKRAAQDEGRLLSLSTWGVVVLEPFSFYQNSYAAQERQYLTHCINQSIASLQSLLDNPLSTFGPMDIAYYLTNTHIVRTFSHVDGAADRCLSFTKGFGVRDLVSVVDQFVRDVVGILEGAVGHIRARCGLDNRVKLNPSSVDTEGMMDDDEDAEDWTHFQVGLRLVGLCLLIGRRIDKIQKFIRGESFTGIRPIVDLAMQVRQNRSEILKDADLSCANLFFKMTKNGDEDGVDDLRTDNGGPDDAVSTSHAALHLLVKSDLVTPALQTLLVLCSDQDVDLFPLARSSNAALTTTCQRFVFDTMFAAVIRPLNSLPNLPVWSQPTEKTTTLSPLKLEIPSFSLSPSSYVTAFGEHLLILPQHFEPYANDEALAFSIDTLPYRERSGEEEDPTPTTSEQITHIWLTSIARGSMRLYLTRILEIPYLCPSGARQLATDLGFLFNVLKALEIEGISELVDVRGMCEADEEEVKREVDSSGGGVKGRIRRMRRIGGSEMK